MLRTLPPVVPLLYGKPVGESQLVPSYALVIAPLTALLITIVNFMLTKFSLKDTFLKNILNWSTVLVSVLSFITVTKVIFLVGSL